MKQAPANPKLKYLAGFLVIACIIGYLISTTFKSSLQYYVTASELISNKAKYQDKTLKVAGRAEAIKLEGGGDTSLYHFTVAEGGQSLEVRYRGFVPDTFKEGSDVVVTGHLLADGKFEGTEVLAKCASKYEAKVNP